MPTKVTELAGRDAELAVVDAELDRTRSGAAEHGEHSAAEHELRCGSRLELALAVNSGRLGVQEQGVPYSRIRAARRSLTATPSPDRPRQLNLTSEAT